MGLRSKKAFTLIELLVVIAIIALLLSILMPALTKVKKQAQAAVCMSNLKQWGVIYSMYAQENNDNFPQSYAGGGLNDRDAYWCFATMSFYDDASLRFCPSAKRNKWAVAQVQRGISPTLIGSPPAPQNQQTYGRSFLNYGPFAPENTASPTDWWDAYPEGSYGLNEWCASPVDGNWTFVENDYSPKFWRKIDKVTRPDNVPMFMDSACVDTYPLNSQRPPAEPDQGNNYLDISMVTMDRHAGGINAVFVDASARKVFLKELWKLKWQRQFDTNGQYTKAGGATRSSWPDWMEKYKEF